MTLDDGTMVVESNTFPPGHDKNPLSDAQLRVKFDGLAIPAIGREASSLVWDRVMRLDRDDSPHEILRHVVAV